MAGALLAQRLVESCARYRRRVALDDGARRVTYEALAEAARSVAAKLARRGLGPDEPVLVAVSNLAADLSAFFAVWLAGGVVVPLHRHAAPATVERVKTATGARLLLDLAPERSRLAAAPGEDFVHSWPRSAAPDPLLEGAAWTIFTSGSTGLPKGAVLAESRYAAKLDMIDRELEQRLGGATLLVLQLTFAFGQWLSLLTLLKGGTLHIDERFAPRAALEVMARERIRCVGLVPSMLRRLRPLVDAGAGPGYDGLVVLGGEPLAGPLVAWLRGAWPNASPWDIYGLTETGTCDFFVAPGEYPAAADSIGRPGAGIEYRLAPQDGELLVRSPYAMRGYVGEPALTAAAFDGDWLRTGDLARVREDGRVALIGRSKDVIVRGGAKISPLELESALLAHPAVAGALAAAAPDPLYGEAVHVLVVPREGHRIDEAALLAWLAPRLDRYKHPQRIVIGEELPAGATGKSDRAALRRLLRERG